MLWRMRSLGLATDVWGRLRFVLIQPCLYGSVHRQTKRKELLPNDFLPNRECDCVQNVLRHQDFLSGYFSPLHPPLQRPDRVESVLANADAQHWAAQSWKTNSTKLQPAALDTDAGGRLDICSDMHSRAGVSNSKSSRAPLFINAPLPWLAE